MSSLPIPNELMDPGIRHQWLLTFQKRENFLIIEYLPIKLAHLKKLKEKELNQVFRSYYQVIGNTEEMGNIPWVSNQQHSQTT